MLRAMSLWPQFLWKCNVIGVRDHFRLGGGAQHLLPEFLIFARKVEYVWAMHFCLTWEGGGGEESSFFGGIEYGTAQRGRGYPPPTVGTVWY